MTPLLPILLAYTLAAISPGPAVVYIIECGTFVRRSVARAAALGVSVGSFCWVAVVSFGIGQLVRSRPAALPILKYVSALLLSYFLVKSVVAIFARKKAVTAEAHAPVGARTHRTAFIQGLLINLLNPTALVFFLSLFAPMLSETGDPRDLIFCVAGVTLISVSWYQLVVTLASHPTVQRRLIRSERGLRAAFALLYLYFLIRLLVRA